MNRRQLLGRTAVAGVVWATPSVLAVPVAFAAGSVTATTTTPPDTTPPAAPNLVGNPSFQDAAAYTSAPSWSFT